MRQRKMSTRMQRRGYVMASVLLFITVSFGLWVLLYRSSTSALQVDKVRTLRISRATWTTPAMTQALALLKTGKPTGQGGSYKLKLVQNGQTRYFVVTFDKITAARWTVTCAPTSAASTLPNLPLSF